MAKTAPAVGLYGVLKSCFRAEMLGPKTPEEVLASIDSRYGLSLSAFVSELTAPCVFLDSAAPPSAENLIKSYETFVASQSRATEGLSAAKRHGVVYTPPPIADEIIADALQAWRSSERSTEAPSSILDPACGAGLFLVRALRALLKPTKNVVPTHSLNKTIGCALMSLYGVDRDPLAVQLTKLSLLLVAREYSPSFTLSAKDLNIRCGDALLAPLHTTAPLPGIDEEPFVWHRDLMLSVQGGFDIIIGNPPYGLSRDERLSAAENRQLKAEFQEFRSGKVNKYLLFMARALQLLHPTGCLAFIVPNAWLGIEAGAPLRHRLLQQRSLQLIRHYGPKAFPGVGVETVSLLVNQGTPHEEIALHDVPRKDTVHIRTSSCVELLDGRIPLLWPNGADQFLTDVRVSSIRLSSDHSPFTPYIALQAYATGKGSPPQTKEDVAQRTYDRDAPGVDTLPYLDGKDVRRFAYRWQGKHLRFGPFLAEFPPRARYDGPRILIREILGAAPFLLQAAVIEEPMLYNRSVLHVVLKSGAVATHAYALAAILNSPVASALIHLCGRKSQRSLFPKIVNDDLKSFFLPSAFTHGVVSPALSTLAEIGRSWTQQPPSTRTQLQRIEVELLSAVADAYHLSPESRAFIERFTASPAQAGFPVAA